MAKFNILKSMWLIINYKTIILSVLSSITTGICHKYNYVAEFPMSLVSVAIIFPVVFSINSAYKRREDALIFIADMKAHGISIYLASRDWLTLVPNPHPTIVKNKMAEIFTGIKAMFLADTEKEAVLKERQIHEGFSEMSDQIQYFREAGLNASEISRVNQYLSKMMLAFEKLKTIYHYRTPVTLRSYSKVFIYSFPVLFAPFFASIFEDSNHSLGYVMPVLCSFILVSLDSIQDLLENPFDQIGEDDIRLETEDYMELFHEKKL